MKIISVKKLLRDNVRIKLQIYRDRIEIETMKNICTWNVIFYDKKITRERFIIEQRAWTIIDL